MSDMVRVMVFDRTDAYRCDIDPDRIMAMDYEDALNGVHSLTITTTQELEKTDRLLIRDGMGIWHEYVVLGSKPTTATATWSRTSTIASGRCNMTCR